MARVFRLFISSTFQDWQSEREYLRAYVFPRIQKLCEDHHARFLPVDLRWGISEEAGKTHETVGICLEEIERCQRLTPKPNFLILLGDRYGWRPVPPVIPKKQWDELIRLNILKDLTTWKRWYKLDANSIPSQYVLQPKSKEWEVDESKLREQLDQLVDAEHAFSEDELAFLIGAVTEQEIVRGALSIGDAQAHVHAFERTFSNEVKGASFVDMSGDDIDALSKQSLDTLKKRLSNKLGNNYHRLEAQLFNESWVEGKRPENYLEALGKQVFDSLKNVIEKELRESNDSDEVDAPETECFIGRSRELDALMKNGNQPLMVFGNPGSGKSTLLSRYVQLLETKGVPVLPFWIGRDPACATGDGLFREILKQLKEENFVMDGFPWGSYSTAGFAESFGLLTRALDNLRPEKSGLIVVVDAVDQWDKADPARELRWIPCDNRFVFSSLDENQSGGFSFRFGENTILHLDQLSKPDAEELLSTWLNRNRRRLQPLQRETLTDVFDGMPLHLRVLYEESKHWHSYDSIPDQLPNTANQAIQQMYERLAEKHGEIMVNRTLAYLTVAPNGLGEGELLSLLRLDDNVVAAFRCRSPQSPSIDALPEIVWSRLFHDLEPFLTERRIHGELLFDFYHMQFRRVAEQWIGSLVLEDCQKRFAEMLLIKWGNQGGDVSNRVLALLPEMLFRNHSIWLTRIVRNKSFMEKLRGFESARSQRAAWLAIVLSHEKKCLNDLLDMIKCRANEVGVVQVSDVAEQQGLSAAMQIACIQSPQSDVEGVFAKYLSMKYQDDPDAAEAQKKAGELLVKKGCEWNFILDNKESIVVRLHADTGILPLPSWLREYANAIRDGKKNPDNIREDVAKASMALLALDSVNKGKLKTARTWQARAQGVVRGGNVTVSAKPEEKKVAKKTGLKKAVLSVGFNMPDCKGLYYYLMSKVISKLYGNEKLFEYIGNEKTTMDKVASRAEEFDGDESNLIWLDEIVSEWRRRLPFDYPGEMEALVRGFCLEIDNNVCTLSEAFSQLPEPSISGERPDYFLDRARLALCIHACGSAWNVNDKDDLIEMSGAFASIAAYQCFWCIVGIHFSQMNNEKMVCAALEYWLQPYSLDVNRRKQLISPNGGHLECLSAYGESPDGNSIFYSIKEIYGCFLLRRQVKEDPFEPINQDAPDWENDPALQKMQKQIDSIGIDDILKNSGSVKDVSNAILESGLDSFVEPLPCVLSYVESEAVDQSRKISLLNEVLSGGFGRDEFDDGNARAFGNLCMNVGEQSLAKGFYQKYKNSIAGMEEFYEEECGHKPIHSSLPYAKILLMMAEGDFSTAYDFIRKLSIDKGSISLMKRWLKWEKQEIADQTDEIAKQLWGKGEYAHVIRCTIKSQYLREQWSLLQKLKDLPVYCFSEGMIEDVLQLSDSGKKLEQAFELIALDKASSSSRLAEKTRTVIERHFKEKDQWVSVMGDKFTL